jgi:PASTA domain
VVPSPRADRAMRERLLFHPSREPTATAHGRVTRKQQRSGLSDLCPPTTLPTKIPTANPVPGPDDDQDAPTSMPTGDPSGRPPIVVPELRGQSQADAVDALAGLRLRARVQQRADDAPRGQVIGTEPPAGARVMPGTRVTLFVSNGVITSGDLTVPENALADLDGGAESEGGEDTRTWRRWPSPKNGTRSRPVLRFASARRSTFRSRRKKSTPERAGTGGPASKAEPSRVAAP